MKPIKIAFTITMFILGTFVSHTVFAAGNIIPSTAADCTAGTNCSQFLDLDYDNDSVKDRINWSPANGGATVSDTGLSGYIFGETVGWINLNPSNAGVDNTCSGELSGYAWGDTTGWINFSPTNGGVSIDPATGEFSGYAWASGGLGGWIKFDCSTGDSCVKTTWDGCSTGNPPSGGPGPTVCNNNSDDDGDGFVDYPADPGCISLLDSTEDNPTNPPVTPPVIPPTNPPTTPPTNPPTTPPTNPPTNNPPVTPPVIPPTNPPTTPNNPSSGFTPSVVMSGIIEAIKPIAVAIGSVGLLSTIPGFTTRITNLIFSIPFYRRRRPWGIVFDSESKQSIDPAYVTVYNADTNAVIDTKITDINGRYGFLLPVGNYRMVAQKTHYQFPSQKLAVKQSDEVYGDLYFGEVFTVTDDNKNAIVTLNMPMDRMEVDWNQEEKKRMGLFDFFTRNSKLWETISMVLFAAGFVFSIFAIITSPNVWNSVVFGLYIFFSLLHVIGFGPVSLGVITNNSGTPIPSAVIRVWSAHLGTQIAQRVTNDKGQYYLLVTNGDYYVTIDVKNASGGYDRLFTSETMKVKQGLINKSFQV